MCQTNLKDTTMNTSSANAFDFTSDLCEIGLMAAASPDFADQVIRALLAAGENTKDPAGAGEASATQAAA
jgi:hypothetical protein